MTAGPISRLTIASPRRRRSRDRRMRDAAGEGCAVAVGSGWMPLTHRISGSRIFAELWTETSTAKAPSPAVIRMARSRARCRKGVRCVTIEVFDREVRPFMRACNLPADKRDDPKPIAHAVHKFLDWTLWPKGSVGDASRGRCKFLLAALGRAHCGQGCPPVFRSVHAVFLPYRAILPADGRD